MKSTLTQLILISALLKTGLADAQSAEAGHNRPPQFTAAQIKCAAGYGVVVPHQENGNFVRPTPLENVTDEQRTEISQNCGVTIPAQGSKPPGPPPQED